jgi:all-trans-retinol dehydrogenase (NAD+)
VLVHNAGVGSPGSIEDHTREQWERVLAVNAAAPLFLTQALLRQLRAAAPKARIVIVSSDSGRFRSPRTASLSPTACRRRPSTCSPDAPVAPERAADAAYDLATLPDDAPSGRLWEDNKLIDW